MSEQVVDLTKGVYRLLYAGFLRGRRINAVSLQAEALFWRLHAIADDFGNFHAEPNMLTADAFPRRQIRPSMVAKLLKELGGPPDPSDADSTLPPLVTFYEADGEQYGHIVGFEDLQPLGHDKNRNKRKGIQRYPLHPGAASETKTNEGVRSDTKANDEKRPEYVSEYESESHTDTHNETESESETVAVSDADSGSPQGARAPISCSDSLPLTRLHARLRYRTATVGFIGKRDQCRLPSDHKLSKADRTCIENVFDDVWPEDDEDEAACRARWKRLMELVADAARNGRSPMAWLQDAIKRERLVAA